MIPARRSDVGHYSMSNHAVDSAFHLCRQLKLEIQCAQLVFVAGQRRSHDKQHRKRYSSPTRPTGAIYLIRYIKHVYSTVRRVE